MADPGLNSNIYKSRFGKLKSINKFFDKIDSMFWFPDNGSPLGLFYRENRRCIEAEATSNQIRRMLVSGETKLEPASMKFLETLMESQNQILAQKLVPGIRLTDLPKKFNLEITPPSVENKYPIHNFFKYRVQCLKYMSDISTFIDYAFAVNLLTGQHQNDIFSKIYVDEQICRICEILDTKLPAMSDAFLYALVKSGNDYLADLFLYPKCVAGIDRDFSHLNLHAETDNAERQGKPVIFYPSNNCSRVVIIDNEEFSDPDMYREGSARDREGLELFFGELGFEVIVKRNLTAEQMKVQLREEIRDEKGRTEDYFILFILSHGKGSEITGTDMKRMDYSVIFEEFATCSIWKEKPKLIYIQACREIDDKQTRNVSSFIHPGGHLYIMFAAIPGGIGYRNTLTGSRLIQTLIEVYREDYATTDIETMGIKIKEKVYNKGKKGQQIAVCHSSLIKRVILKTSLKTKSTKQKT